MASRYLRASGNWNGPVWASTQNGTAGSASTPTASDDVWIWGGHTLTINQNVTFKQLSLRWGTINNTGNYNVTINGGASIGSSLDNDPVTLNMGNGTWTFNFGTPDSTIYNQAIDIEGTQTNINAGSSVVIINDYAYDSFLDLSNKIFSDLIINLNGSGDFAITGSPTFRSLIIQSKNNAAHTVQFDAASANNPIQIGKFVAMGASTSARLLLRSTSSVMPGQLAITDSCYGQFVNVGFIRLDGGPAPRPPMYMGSNSITDGGSWNWNALLQDPPKISTLVDPLTTAPGSNPNWTASGTVTQVTSGAGGGGYTLASGAKLVSTDTYDMADSGVIVDIPGVTSRLSNDDDLLVGVGSQPYFVGVFLYFGEIYVYDPIYDQYLYIADVSNLDGDYFKIMLESGTLYYQNSATGQTWSTLYEESLPFPVEYLNSSRVNITSDHWGGGDGTAPIGSINPSLASPNKLQAWTGTEWKPGKVWDGSTWREDAKVWDGSQWV